MANEQQLRKYIRSIIKEELKYPDPYTMHDDEGRMARQQLIKIAQSAVAIANMMDDNTQLEAWVQDKISVSEHNLTAIYDYLMYENGGGEEGVQEYN